MIFPEIVYARFSQTYVGVPVQIPESEGELRRQVDSMYMPLAGVGAVVPGLTDESTQSPVLQGIRNRDIILYDSGLARHVSCKHRPSRRSAQRHGTICIHKPDTVFGQPVHIRSRYVHVPGAAHRSRTLLVRHDINDVRPVFRTPGGIRRSLGVQCRRHCSCRNDRHCRSKVLFKVSLHPDIRFKEFHDKLTHKIIFVKKKK